ncbi:hypothetical protein SAMN00120144_4054 [Hymenobacter roseosalivarius DSM 11622]|uniref:Uncharacterized protein n=1 Tax=Hymenobacter roseosalivarius DSM 11622 TaxID=645990 RepID=A0A1W1UWA8_9BACT|nr:hypothetical protein [Hymenobacter roseosalivarius]SMB85373.1 hypothetical protein SAMN00120144_4054 [Hymenobacter roseosalivarius DSM 11622]
MIDQEADFLVEVLELIPEDSVFGFFVSYDELLPDLEAAGYPVNETRNAEIPVAEKHKLLELIQSKRLHRRVDHFDIMHGQEYLLKAYDHMISTWLSNKVNVSQSFIERYSLEPDGEYWLVGEFPELDD